MLRTGDLVCFDTDAVGAGGYSVDFSRTFLCGDDEPDDASRRTASIRSAGTRRRFRVKRNRASVQTHHLVGSKWYQRMPLR
ncbi:MAG: hypothetical protein ACO3RU_04030 [Planctomycetota bacterium]